MSKKILLIEDEKVLSEMYVDKLTEVGFKVISTIEAKEGLELTKKERPDLIILDLLLPQENGIVFLTWLKKESEISSIPVVIFSNFDEPETRKKAFKLGAKAYLIKTNYTPREMVEIIRDYLR